jgi:hypothetical protein
VIVVVEAIYNAGTFGCAVVNLRRGESKLELELFEAWTHTNPEWLEGSQK